MNATKKSLELHQENANIGSEQIQTVQNELGATLTNFYLKCDELHQMADATKQQLIQNSLMTSLLTLSNPSQTIQQKTSTTVPPLIPELQNGGDVEEIANARIKSYVDFNQQIQDVVDNFLHQLNQKKS